MTGDRPGRREMPAMVQEDYRAAGGVVIHDGQVLLLWRESRGEWRLPKGHVESGETDEQAALREVAEETGYWDLAVVADLGSRLLEFDVIRDDGVGRHVNREEHYFLMSANSLRTRHRGPEELKFDPRWVPVGDAASLLTFEFERGWLGAAARQDSPVDMARAEFPILEHDPDRTALIAPRPRRGRRAAPERVVLCFFLEVIEELCGQGRAEEVTAFQWEHGTHPLYALTTEFGTVGVMHPGVGAPVAAGMLESAIVSGGRYFVACGGAGALSPGLALGHVVVPSAAVRDEGTSYHYLEPSREVELDADVVNALVAVLVERDVPHQVAKTWTTDAPYRETPARIRRRRDEGCVTVEMETSALAAVARFRGVRFGQYLYAGDDVSGEAWDHRGWNTHSSRMDLFRLAVEAVTRLPGLVAG